MKTALDCIPCLVRQSLKVAAKGQANYETLDDCNREVFFLLKIKCPPGGPAYRPRGWELGYTPKPPRHPSPCTGEGKWRGRGN